MQPLLATITASPESRPAGAVVVELDAVRARHAHVPEEVLEDLGRVADLLEQRAAEGDPVVLDLHVLCAALVAELRADLAREDPWPTRP